MSLSASHFLDDLYDEHAEEAAFLYDFVRASILEADFQWMEAREFEDRREAHIDALIIGERTALARCRGLAEDGPGELYVYASLILRQGRTDEFAERMMALELRRADSLDALTSAIAEHADAGQLSHLSADNLEACCSVTLLAISRAMDRREISVPVPTLMENLHVRLMALASVPGSGNEAGQDNDDEAGEEPRAALFGTVPGNAFGMAHREGVQAQEDWLRDESIFNLLTTGDATQRHLLRQAVESSAGGHAAFMTSGGASYAHSLIAAMTMGGSSDIIQALAISGLPEVVRPLVMALDSDFAESAAAALYCITGAELMESVFEEEEIEEDELFDDERAPFQAGDKPKRVDGSAFGEERTRFSIDPERWKQWLMNNKSQFVVGTRYRFGEAMTPDSLVRALHREESPSWIRLHTARELRCRYGVTAPFHVSLTVRQQLPGLLTMGESVVGMQVVPGKWYLGGRIMAAGE